MTVRLPITFLGIFGVGAILTWAAGVRTQEQPPPPPNGEQQEGVEVMTRGPVHEAFAEPVIRGPRAAPVVPKKPPEPIEELPPDQRPSGGNIQWVPGYWAWDEDRNDFLWVSGIWRDIPPGRQWVPGHWENAEDAYQWVAGYWTTIEQTTAEFLPQPPDPIQESVAPAANASEMYVPGTWIWRTRYLWRPGFWMTYRPGWVWVPAHYVWTPAGFVFVDGYWDYPLANRGLLFAPVVIAPGYWNRPAWVYRPFYAVSDTFLLGCLFVRPSYCHYYFGDYFEPRYNRLGFVAWVDFRMGNRFYDPLLNYYSFHFRDNPSWVRDLRQVYVARRNGELPRPPRTLLLQNQFVQNNRNVTINNFRMTNTNITNIRNVTNVMAVASLTQVKQQGVSLQRVSADQMARERKDVQRIRGLSQERSRVEAQVRSQGSPIAKGSEARGPVRMELPTLRSAARPTTQVKNLPPSPTMPNPRPHEGAVDRMGRPTETINPRGIRQDGTRPGTTDERSRNVPGKDVRPMPEHPGAIKKPEPRIETPRGREESKPKPPPPENRSGTPPPRPEAKKAPPPEPKKAPPPEPKSGQKPNKDKPPDK